MFPLQGRDFREHVYQCQPSIMLIIVLVNAVDWSEVKAIEFYKQALISLTQFDIGGRVWTYF